MPKTERVTVTLPARLVRSIDQLEKNRSRFVSRAVERELERRRREELRRSLAQPHADAEGLADAGLVEWANMLPDEDEALLDESAGHQVRWIEGRGWVEDVG